MLILLNWNKHSVLGKIMRRSYLSNTIRVSSYSCDFAFDCVQTVVGLIAFMHVAQC